MHYAVLWKSCTVTNSLGVSLCVLLRLQAAPRHPGAGDPVWVRASGGRHQNQPPRVSALSPASPSPPLHCLPPSTPSLASLPPFPPLPPSSGTDLLFTLDALGTPAPLTVLTHHCPPCACSVPVPCLLCARFPRPARSCAPPGPPSYSFIQKFRASECAAWDPTESIVQYFIVVKCTASFRSSEFLCWAAVFFFFFFAVSHFFFFF